MIRGIDVSTLQGDINWNTVKSAGNSFVIIKATQGKDSKYPTQFVDSRFDRYYAGAKSVGLNVGAYHFATFNTIEETKIQAEFFISALKGKQFEYPVYVDVENLTSDRSRTPHLSDIPKKQLTDYVILFCEMLEKAGYWAGVYSNKDWFQNKLDKSRLDRFAQWMAQFTYNEKKPTWCDNFGVWQNSDKGNGKSYGVYSTYVDTNISYIDYPTLIKGKKLNGFSNTTVVTPPPAVVITPPSTIKDGTKVKVKQGAKSYTGGNIASFIYTDTWIVYGNPVNDRAVINKNVSGKNAIMTPVNVNDLIIV